MFAFDPNSHPGRRSPDPRFLVSHFKVATPVSASSLSSLSDLGFFVLSVNHMADSHDNLAAAAAADDLAKAKGSQFSDGDVASSSQNVDRQGVGIDSIFDLLSEVVT